ncbi:Receptor-like protein 6 [Linum perenne]
MANLLSCFPSHDHTFFVVVIIIIAFFHLCCSVSSTQIRCLEEDKSLLLRLKQEISIDVNRYRQDFSYRYVSSPPKVWSWNDTDNHEDCCLWEGVTCDSYSGHVVGLDLSESSIVGGINGSSSIFHLRHLRRLSLADNDILSSLFPSGFGNLSSLTHLNLSDAGFQGPIPEHDISRLEKLVSLDLTSSRYGGSSVDMEKLVKNLTQLKVLRLDGVDLSRTINNKSWSTLPAGLQELSLWNCNFTGEALQLSSILHLKSSLTHLTLSDNDLAWNLSGYSFIQFPHLIDLQLTYCKLYGRLLNSIFSIPNLQHLDVSFNFELTGTLPEFPIGKNSLQVIHLSYTKFSGKLPDSIHNLASLEVLYLDNCMFHGVIPSSIDTLTELRSLGLSGNNFSGPLPLLTSSNHIQNLDFSSNNFNGTIPISYSSDQFRDLQFLNLGYNNLGGQIPPSLFSLPNLSTLALNSNQLEGQLEEFHNSSSQLETIDLSNNKLQGHLPMSIFNISNLYYFLVAANNFSGRINLLDITNSENLYQMDLSENHFQVGVDGELMFSSLQVLRCSSCNIESFPNFSINSSNLAYLHLSNNKIKGYIPPSICYMKDLDILDLSTNHINGIPPCLTSLPSLRVLSLRNNQLSGMRPGGFAPNCTLRSLDVNQNYLYGKLPESLGLCKDLEVVDVGKNYLTGKFPLWLENLPLLRILVLHSNQFGGTIESKNSSGFPLLQIFDVSSNKFVGRLPLGWFTSWKEMMKQATPPGSQTEVINLTDYIQYPGIAYKSYYQDSVTVTAKGIEREYDKILTSFVLIDVSNNRFTGEISEAIARLESIHLLNLSNNHFTGHIPVSFGQLSQLESLDLSSNKLSGNIPPQLTKLTFMSKLNLSHNSLTGEIPRGFQFENFEPDSYEGNPGLCGKPLLKSCYNVKSPPLSNKPDDEDEGGHGFIDWEYYRLGIECGVGTGLILGSLLLRLKQEISIDVDLYINYPIEDGYVPPPPKVWSWNGTDNHEDCCLWEGVTCDLRSGHVVGLDLSSSFIDGGINRSSSIFHLRHLRRLSLAGNYMDGIFPNNIFLIPNLQHIDISGNLELTGTLPEFPIGNNSLHIVDLSNTKFSGKLPDSIHNLASLEELYLHNCMFHGVISSSIDTLTELRSLGLSGNNFSGPLPLLASSSNIQHLGFSSNKFNGSIPLSYDKFQDLVSLDLRNNNLGGNIPPSLFSLPNLDVLALSSNQLEGRLEVFHNSSSKLIKIDLSHNKLQGHLPMSIFNMSNLGYLSVAFNNFSGKINLLDITNIGKLLYLLDLSENHFQVEVSGGFTLDCILKTLDVHQNHLYGHLSESLGLCKNLEVIDVGKNYLSGKFPLWLENLPLLRILVLHSNQFGGLIGSRNQSAFHLLQIFDVSSNKFVGRLPSWWFTNWEEMMKRTTPSGSRSEVINFDSIDMSGITYQDSITVIAKGIEREYDKILTSFVLIDVSNNRFTGEIPEAIAHLESIHLLNLSNNHFTGHIPGSFGQLSQLESLDLSSNNLSGNIPPQLTKLTFMSKLNLSHNSLTGEIPRGFQFENFEPESYEGNPGLCGKPLPKSCYNVKSPPLSNKPDNEDEGGHGFIDWEYYRLGIECGVGTGLILGFVVAYLVFGNFLAHRRRIRRYVIRPLRT